MADEETTIGQRLPVKHPLIRRWFSRLLAGLAAVIPIVGTVWVLYIVYKILFRVGEKIIEWIFRLINMVRGVDPGATLVQNADGEWVMVGPDGLAVANQTRPLRFEFFGDDVVWFLIPVILLLIAGFAVTHRPGRAVSNWVDRAITRVPILGFVYAALKQFVDALRNLGGPRKFKGVAYIEYPSEGCRLIGFVTGNFHDPQAGKDVTSVFIPTSPNPMTGFIVIVDDDKVFDSEMTLEEASKMILSAGLVAPESFGNGMK